MAYMMSFFSKKLKQQIKKKQTTNRKISNKLNNVKYKINKNKSNRHFLFYYYWFHSSLSFVERFSDDISAVRRLSTLSIALENRVGN